MTSDIISCEHCGLDTVAPLYLEKNPFCCHGCKTVYQLLKDKGLDHYYDLKKSGASIRSSSPAEISNEKYSYLDDEKFLEDYSVVDRSGMRTMEFYIEGVHCVACLWLVEKLPEFVPGVYSAHLNMGKSIAKISILPGTNFSIVASQLNQFGYKPHALHKDADAEELLKKEDRSMLIKIGIAAGCAGNIMIMAVSLYAGASGEFGKYFEWFSLFLALPVLLYCAIPFYQGAWAAIRRKTVSIDVPIAFALFLGTFSGIYHMIRGYGDLYFDTLAILVFLLLFARYVLKKIQQSGLNKTEVAHFFSNGSILKLDKNENIYREVHSKYLELNDQIKILPGEVIPADGVILEGRSSLNTSLLTGESLPVIAEKDDKVFSGTVNLDKELIVKVDAIEADTRLGKIISRLEEERVSKAPIVSLADYLAKFFVVVVFFLATCVFSWFAYQGQYDDAFNRALTLIIITCPCALGLATPLTLSRSLGKLARNGMIIKSEDVLQKLSEAENIFLDKTGTLTHGNFQVVSWESLNQNEELKNIVYSLEKKSTHPLAIALVRYIEEQSSEGIKNLDIIDFKELLGLGVEGMINGVLYQVRTLDEEDRCEEQKLASQLGLYKDSELLIRVVLKDQVRADSLGSLNKLKSMGLAPYILSGDHASVVDEVAKSLEISKENYQAKVLPEDKGSKVKEAPHSIMVGDGANDALALSSAYVGIAVKGSVEVSLRAADVYLSTSGVSSIVKLVEVSKETMKVIYRNLNFSLIYNVLGAYLAMNGMINPLLAAILMPLSSLTVVASTMIGTKKLREY